jgi:DNA-binding NtrC family response regulator
VLVELARREYGMVGQSPQMFEVYRLIEKIGPTDGKVMVLGPTGSGKELVARALHRRSRRSDKPLTVFNCNHRSPDLVESELFGHVRGSFTGAIADRVGRLEATDGGTLFLDEIGNLDYTTQGKLLRVLEDGKFSRLGSNDILEVDVRLICATNCDLERRVEEGAFRHDLYYRLQGICIHLPALRDRREDIPALVTFFAERHCRNTVQETKLLSHDAVQLMIEFDWPGNVRQLMDCVQSLIDLSPSALITRDEVADFLGHSHSDCNETTNLSDRVREFKRTEYIKALTKHHGNLTAAAAELGMHRANLSRALGELQIDKSQFD